MTELMLLLMVWINGATGLPIPTNTPSIQFVSDVEMFRIAYQCDDDKLALQYCDEAANSKKENLVANTPIALYNNEQKTIILKDQWNRKTIKNRSILLHELVHHMQYEAGIERDYPCRGAIEREAYEAQNKWLKEFHDTDIFVVLDLGKLYYITITHCTMFSHHNT